MSIWIMLSLHVTMLGVSLSGQPLRIQDSSCTLLYRSKYGIGGALCCPIGQVFHV